MELSKNTKKYSIQCSCIMDTWSGPTIWTYTIYKKFWFFYKPIHSITAQSTYTAIEACENWINENC